MKIKLEALPDHRKPSNATTYSVVDAVLSAYRVFFMQSPSLLSHEQDRKRVCGKNNLESLLRASEDALRVNWCEITVRNEETGKVLFKSAFITNFALSDQNVAQITWSGRARWKNENESHNTLKTQGYNLDHTFGHGDHYLSMILLSLNRLAVLTHTFMHMSDSLYKLIRQDLGARKTFFDDVRALTRYLDFASGADLMHFMATRLELDLPPPASSF